MMRFAVVIEKGPTSYGAYVPDLPGCIAVAESAEEVRREIAEAIQFHLEGMELHGETAAQPTSEVEYVEVIAGERV
jgi:predicted RNase H-like HicB family nuclease